MCAFEIPTEMTCNSCVFFVEQLVHSKGNWQSLYLEANTIFKTMNVNKN